MKAKYFRFKGIKEVEIITAHGILFYPLDLMNKLHEYYLSIDHSKHVKEIIILPSLLIEFESEILNLLIEEAQLDGHSINFINWIGECSFYCED